jgi:phosphate transport system substrate-binding protein
MNMKKITAVAAVLLASAMIFAGGKKDAANEEITVISREDGSGTRGAFIELLGVEQKDSSGNKVDYTTETASISNSTSVVMTSVAQNSSAIGYISLGSLNSTVKALSIDGAEPTVANIKSDAYKIARPFNIATKGVVSDVTQDFINYILSIEGQKVVESKGYIAVETKGSFTGTKPAGKIVVAGSSSVTPVMEKLKEEYLKLNPNAQIEVMLSDSTTGMNSAIEGICDIGMASRAVKSSELDKGLTAIVIAIDGIAIIVNKDSPVNALTSAQVRDIYMGKITTWSQIPR